MGVGSVWSGSRNWQYQWPWCKNLLLEFCWVQCWRGKRYLLWKTNLVLLSWVLGNSVPSSVLLYIPFNSLVLDLHLIWFVLIFLISQFYWGIIYIHKKHSFLVLTNVYICIISTSMKMIAGSHPEPSMFPEPLPLLNAVPFCVHPVCWTCFQK